MNFQGRSRRCGHLMLLKFVFSSTPLHFSSIFNMPAAAHVGDILNKLAPNSQWGGSWDGRKVHRVNICQPNQVRGLNSYVTSFKTLTVLQFSPFLNLRLTPNNFIPILNRHSFQNFNNFINWYMGP